MQAELFVCAVACSGFLGRKLGQEDPRTGTQETQEPGLTGRLHQWRSGGRAALKSCATRCPYRPSS